MALTESAVGVRYIGRCDPFVDRLYKSGLTFFPEQERFVPSILAKKLLRHSDVFERVMDIAPPVPEPLEPSRDDTEDLLAMAAKTQAEQRDEYSRLQDVRDQIHQMDKDTLVAFAQSQYRQDPSKRLSVEKIRDQVLGWVDQYGVSL